LLPKLQKAADKGEDARVMTVLAAGKGGPIDMDDLGLKNGAGLKRNADVTTTYNDLMVEVNTISCTFFNVYRNSLFVIQKFHSRMLIQGGSIRTLPAICPFIFDFRNVLRTAFI
jgi:hypothetical protein